MERIILQPQISRGAMQLTDTILLATFVLLSGTALEVDWYYISLAGLGSVSGSLMLAYFRRNHLKKEIIMQSGASTLGAIFIGSAVISYYQIERVSYIAFCYFLISFVNLTLIKSALDFTEKNAAQIVRSIVSTVFKIEKEQIQSERANSIDESTKAGDIP